MYLVEPSQLEIKKIIIKLINWETWYIYDEHLYWVTVESETLQLRSLIIAIGFNSMVDIRRYS